MRIAIVSDIHGNLPAFEAVLADLNTQAPDQVYCGGDLLNRCPWIREVLDLYQDLGWSGVMGNHDLVLAQLNTPQGQPAFQNADRYPDLWWIWPQLAPPDLALLRGLPDHLIIHPSGLPSLRLVHGLPGNPFRGILPETSEATVGALMEQMPESVLLCGHTHRTLYRQSPAWQVINAGSVGLPYDGDPRAQYALLDGADGQWRVTFRRVEYDRERLRQAFYSSGMVAGMGPVAELYLRTAMTGEPYASDFGAWLRAQPDAVRANPGQAVPGYLRNHGPGRWAFFLLS